MSGKRRSPARLDRLARAPGDEARHPDAVLGQHLLAHRLVAGDQEGQRRRAGIAVPLGLQHARAPGTRAPALPWNASARVEDQIGLAARSRAARPGTRRSSRTPIRKTSCPRSRSASAIWYSISGSSSCQAATSLAIWRSCSGWCQPAYGVSKTTAIRIGEIPGMVDAAGQVAVAGRGAFASGRGGGLPAALHYSTPLLPPCNQRHPLASARR